MSVQRKRKVLLHFFFERKEAKFVISNVFLFTILSYFTRSIILCVFIIYLFQFICARIFQCKNVYTTSGGWAGEKQQDEKNGKKIKRTVAVYVRIIHIPLSTTSYSLPFFRVIFSNNNFSFFALLHIVRYLSSFLRVHTYFV